MSPSIWQFLHITDNVFFLITQTGKFFTKYDEELAKTFSVYCGISIHQVNWRCDSFLKHTVSWINISEKKEEFSNFKLLAKDTLSPFTCMNNWTNPPSPFSVLKYTVPVVQRDERVARKKQAFHWAHDLPHEGNSVTVIWSVWLSCDQCDCHVTSVTVMWSVLPSVGPPSREKIWSGEPSQISWARACSCEYNLATVKAFAANPLKKGTETWVEVKNLLL